MTLTATVAAVVDLPAPPALDSQSHPPTKVFAGDRGLASALAAEVEWIWFLAPGARPQKDALERLVLGIQPPGERPASVVSGVAVDSHGRLLEHELAAGTQRDLEAVIRVLPRRLLPIRYAGFANCLVSTDAFGRYGRVNRERFGPYAAFEWTGRVLRENAGYLVPDSLVELPDVSPHPGRGAALSALPATVRMYRTGLWTRGEGVRALTRVVRAAFGPGRPRVEVLDSELMARGAEAAE
jgi:hypothetical protein